MHTYTLRYIFQNSETFCLPDKSRIRPETYTIVLEGGGWIFLPIRCVGVSTKLNGFPSILLFLPFRISFALICPNMNRMLSYCTVGVGNM